MRKRIIALADLHCGHRVGLTPPSHQWKTTGPKRHQHKFARIQQECWHWFTRILDELAPYDIAAINGDFIDGKGKRSGGVEQVEPSIIEQGAMATRVVETVRLKARRRSISVIGTYGTPYHVTTADGDDAEDLVCGIDKIGSHEWFAADGSPCVFDMKHKLNGTSVYKSAATGLIAEVNHNEKWALRNDQPLANVYLRAHAHFLHAARGIDGREWLAVRQPALQAMGSNYGARQCSRPVDWGVCYFDVDDKHELPIKWDFVTVGVKAQKAEVTVL